MTYWQFVFIYLFIFTFYKIHMAVIFKAGIEPLFQLIFY